MASSEAQVTDRCDLTDLLVNACGCRLHRGGQTPEEEAMRDRKPGPWFPAGLTGTCSRCECEIRVGYQIRANGFGGWECCQ